MKKLASLILVFVLCFGMVVSSRADTLSDFSRKITAGSPWEKYDYNVTYETRAKNYLPACIDGSKTKIYSYEVILFGDGTGSVQAIIGQ